jgi:predicted ATPase/DNA-binding SARP family transcriptional activator
MDAKTARQPHGSPTQAPQCRVRLLGAFGVARDGHALDVGSWRPQSARLFRLIVSSPDTRISRDAVIDALWMDASPEAGRRNLDFALHMLRRGLEAEGRSSAWKPVVSDRGWIALSPTVRWDVDLHSFETALAQIESGMPAPQLLAVCEHAASLYGGEPLAEDRYEEWAQPVRDPVLRSWRDLRLRLASLLVLEGSPQAAIPWLERVLIDDPLDEEAVHQMMRALSAGGRKAEALRRFRRLADSLSEELGVEPAAEVQTLAESLQEAAPPGAVGRESATLASRLPAETTTFVGREAEVARVERLLRRSEVRLLTLTGPGGTGKTRLAIEVARRSASGGLGHGFPDVAIFVPLAALGDSAVVPFAVAEALGLKDSGGELVMDLITGRIGEQRLLLVLDNLEHLLGAARVVTRLLRSCSGMKALVTSRTVLRVAGEYEYRVPTLGTPKNGAVHDIERAAKYDALRLFSQRAEAVRGDFRLTAANAPVVAEICRRVDGLPLGIELAAARIRHLSPTALLSRLDPLQPARADQGGVLSLLGAGPRDVPERQQGLRRAIDWSYDLLPSDAARLFARLSTFAGGCTLEAAERVSGGDGGETLADVDVLESLATLVENSLVFQVEQSAADEPNDGRYSMLQTIRAYAAEKLTAVGEEDALWDRLTSYLIDLAETAERELTGPAAGGWLDRLAEEHDNFRAALRRALDRRRPDDALRLAGSLAPFWQARGHMVEGYSWLLEALRGTEGALATRPYAKAVSGAGLLAVGVGDFSSGEVWFRRGLELWKELGDSRAAAATLGRLGVVAQEQGDYEGARRLHEEALPLLRELGESRGIVSALNNLGIIEMESGDPARAVPLYEEALPLARQIGWKHATAAISSNLGILCRQTGDLDACEAHYREALELHRELGNPRGIATLLGNLANLMFQRGELVQARSMNEEATSIGIELGDRTVPAHTFEGLGTIAHAEGDDLRAAKLLGAADALRTAIGHPIPPAELATHEELVASVRAALGPERFDQAWQAGQQLDLHAAADLALAGAQT